MSAAYTAAINMVVSGVISIALSFRLKRRIGDGDLPTSVIRLLMISGSWLLLSTLSYVAALR